MVPLIDEELDHWISDERQGGAHATPLRQSAFGLDNPDELAAAEGAKDVVAERVRALNYRDARVGPAVPWSRAGDHCYWCGDGQWT